MDLVHIEQELLDHLVVEFGDHGRRAVEFLSAAEVLLNLESEANPKRLPEIIAYCLREAMKTIPASHSLGDDGLWRSASRAVTDARRRYDIVRGMPGEDERGALEELLASIDDLDLVHSREGVHERRLIAIMLNRTGATPIVAGTAPVRTYYNLLIELDKAIHGSATLDQACMFWNRCATTLRQLFLPPELRHAELDRLASIKRPSSQDIGLLLTLMAGPNHLRYFLKRISSPVWLEELTETGILDPPPENEPWPAFAAVERLAEDYPQAISNWLNHLYDRHAEDSVRAWFIGRAAVDIGAEGAPMVIRLLRDHATNPGIAALGVLAVEALEPEKELVESLADLLLNDVAWHRAGFADRVIEHLVNGLNESNATRRLQLLSWKLTSVDTNNSSRRLFGYERAGSVYDRDNVRPHDRFSQLLYGYLDIIKHSMAWISTNEVLEIVNTLPDDLQSRIRTWVLGIARDIEINQVIEELANAIAEREPTGDDLPLLDRVIAETDDNAYAELWMRQLGHAPKVGEVARALASGLVPSEWRRAYRWAAILPDQATISWLQPAAIIGAKYGIPTRESLAERPRVEAEWGRSPLTDEELAALSPIEAAKTIAAWRPHPSDGLISARELARTLEGVIKANSDSWVGSPVRIVTELHHPTYINHYLRALAETAKDCHLPIGEVLDVVDLVRAHPWDAAPLGRDDFAFDPDWRGAEHASIEVLRALANDDIGFAGRNEAVWSILESEVRDRSERSGIVTGARDPLDSAINRRCTRALEVALSFMAYEYRTTNSVRPEALALLQECLRLDGTDGIEHRAIIATRLGFLRHISSEWVDGITDLLLGSDAPEGLAQPTADLALKWSRPNGWLLEHFRPMVRDAVVRGVDNAMDHVLIAMLWNVPGYGVEDNIAFLSKSPELLSKAAEMLGRLLRHASDEADHLNLAVSFWEAAIGTNQREGVAGFGWMAEVSTLDDDTWVELTLRTLQLSDGRMDWSHKVGERVAAQPASATSLSVMNYLIRGASDEWDRRGNIEHAIALLNATGGLAGTPEYDRLRTTLLERGALG